MAEKFLMVSLEDETSKCIAKALGNNTCRKILDYLSEHKSVTESQVATELNLPLSTVHYNMQQLLKCKLVVSDEYHYSRKGKEINHYSLANKYIIISHKPVYGIKDKLKDVLPAVIIVFFGSLFFRVIQVLYGSVILRPHGSVNILQEPVESPEVMIKTVPTVMKSAVNGSQAVLQEKQSTFLYYLTQIFNGWFIWFLLGSLITLCIYLLLNYFQRLEYDKDDKKI